MTARLSATALLLVLAGGCGDHRLQTLRLPDAGDAGPPAGGCPSNLVGFATVGAGTVGGGDGRHVTVTNAVDLRLSASSAERLVITVAGRIELTGQVPVKSQKTIVGAPDALLTGGGLDLSDANDVIVQNLSIEKVIKADAIQISSAQNVWIDHCDLSSDLVHESEYYDGLVDIVHGSRNVTVSWTRFHDHYHASLIGHSADNADEDVDQNVTFHHNLFERTDSYNPLIRFGVLHAFNNVYRDIGSLGISSRIGASVLAEANVFERVPKLPLATNEKPDEGEGLINAVGNLAIESGPNDITQTTPWTPGGAYAYVAEPAENVAASVSACVGVGRLQLAK